MKLQCPKCGSRFEAEHGMRELEQSETHDIAAKLGQHWRLVWEYSECSRQEEYGNVPLSKRLRIFKAISQLMDTLMFTYRGRRYRTNSHEVIKAMTKICNLQKKGFTNDNYLYSMLKDTADRLSAEGLSAKEEAARETRRAQGAEREVQGPGRLDFKGMVKKMETGKQDNGEPIRHAHGPERSRRALNGER